MGYTKNVISGFSWHSLVRVGGSLVVLAKIMVVARILSPADFGLFALTMIALGLAEATTQTGINITILQSKHSIRYFLDTAWVIAIVRGLLIGVIMILMGLAMGRYYEEPLLPFLIAFTALVPIIKGFINPSIVLLQKNLEFFKDSAYRLSLILTEAVLAVSLTLMLESVSALILALLGAALFEVVLSFKIFSQKPTWRYLPNRAKAIFQNAKGLSVNAALSYLYHNIDDFLLGKLVGTHNLGLYHNAYSLSHKTNYELAQATHHGTVPIFTKIANDVRRLRRAFGRSVWATLAITGGLSLPFLLFPGFIVRLVLGEQWLAIIPLVPWLALAGVVASFSVVTHSLLISTKRYAPLNLHLGMSLLILAAGLLLLVPLWGLMGAGVALLISRVLPMPILFWGIDQATTALPDQKRFSRHVG